MLKDHSALDIINEELIPGLNKVGKDFETGKAFLPQLLMSAESAKAAFDVLKGYMANQGEVREKKGTIVLATVKGDIHDIGKNIVKVLLENYDYAMLCVDTNMLSSEEFEDMASLFTTAGYQMANGGFYPLTDTCPSAVYKPIDNIFVKGRAKLKSFIVPSVLSTLASDHLPVLSDVLLY